MAARASSIDVKLRLRGQRQFKREVASSAASLEAMGLKGAKALGKFAARSESLKSAGKSMTRNITLPILAAGAASVKMFMDFDDSMNKMVGLVGINRKQVNAWHEDVLDLSTATGIAPKELADSLFFITSAGLRGKTAIDALTASAKAADAGLGETKAVADAVTSAMNAYGPANLKASRATDILTAAVREGKLEAAELAPVIGKVLPLAQAMGVEFDEVAGSMALMSKSGTNAAQGATQVTAILSTFAKPTTQMKDALDKMGLSLGGVRKMIAGKGLLPTLAMLQKKTKAAGIDLSEVFGNKRAITGVLQLTKNLKESKGVLEGVANSAGMSNKAFREAQKTGADKLGDALNSLKVTAIRLGAALGPTVAPMIADLGNAISKLGEGFSKLSPQQRKMILMTLGIAAAIGPVLTVLGYFAGGIGRVLTGTDKFIKFTKGAASAAKGAADTASLAMSTLRTSYVAQTGITNASTVAVLRHVIATKVAAAAQKVAAAATWLWNVAMSANPIMLVVIAIAALVAGFVLAYKKIGWFRAGVDAVWGALKAVFGWIVDHWKLLTILLLGPLGIAIVSIVANFDKIKVAAMAVFGFIKKHWRTILKFAGPFGWAALLIIDNFEAIKSAAVAAFGWVVTAAKGAFNWVKTAAMNAFNWVKSHWKLLTMILLGPIGVAIVKIVENFDKIKSVVRTVFGVVKAVVHAVVGQVVEFIKGRWKQAGKFIQDPIGFAVAWVKNAFNNFIGFVSALPGRAKGDLSGMWDGLKVGFKAAINWVIDKWNGLKFRIPEVDLPGLGPKFGGQTIGVPEIPRLARGGDVRAPGVVEVGERGPEILQLPRAARVTPLDPGPINMKNVIGGVKTIVVKSILDGKTIAESTAQVAEDEAALA
jgi:TP901 family phage tail tape measure protein